MVYNKLGKVVSYFILLFVQTPEESERNCVLSYSGQARASDA